MAKERYAIIEYKNKKKKKRVNESLKKIDLKLFFLSLTVRSLLRKTVLRILGCKLGYNYRE